MKKMMTAALAALMLAGALSAVSGAASWSTPHSVAVVGEGSSPFPVMLSSSSADNSATALGNHF